VEVVSTPVVVHDSRGELLLNLNKDEFRIYDNGLEQPVVDFDMGGAPLSVAFVVETSSRIEALLPPCVAPEFFLRKTCWERTQRPPSLAITTP